MPSVSGVSREGDGVADVGEAGDVGEGALEAEAPSLTLPRKRGRVREGA